MILVIEQPSYVPWLGYFGLMAQSDTWVWYDDVQYTPRDWRNRNRLARAGEAFWITIPVKSQGLREQRICDVAIDWSRPWQRKHLESFRHCCGDAPFFGLTWELYSNHLEKPPSPRLADLVIGLAEGVAELLGLRPRFVRSSTLAAVEGKKQSRLLAICAGLGASTYLSGPRARAYIDSVAFAASGVELRYIVYDYPPYSRGPNPPIAGLSILDALAWLGPDSTAALLRRGRWQAAR